MMEKLKQLIELRIAKKTIEDTIVLKTKPENDRIEQLKKAIKSKTQDDDEHLALIESDIDSLQEQIIASWPIDADRTITIDNAKIVLRETLRPDIANEHDLVKFLIDAIQDPTKIPFSAKWDNKRLVALIECGIVPEALAKVEPKHTIAVTLPKQLTEEQASAGLGALFG